MRPLSISSETVKKYLQRFPNTPSRTLAIKIYRENPEIFKNQEHARGVVRNLRGLKGKLNRKHTESTYFVPKGTFKLNPFNFPHSEEERPKVFHLPETCNNILVLSDLHVPYHNIKALTVALEYGKKEGINCIFINGDLLDFFMISKFVKYERKMSVKDELETVRKILEVFNQEFPNVPIYFLMGNHDIRLQTYLAVKAPELLDMKEFYLEVLLNSPKYNLKVLEDTTLVKMGKLSVTHGHTLLRGFFSPVNPARGAFLRAKQSTLIGHLHKVSTHSETTIGGKTIICYSTGCLCELNPRYNPFANSYSHGFAHVKTNKGMFSVKNLQLVDGVIVN